MLGSYFTTGQQLTIVSAIALAIVALVQHRAQRHALALALLTGSALVLRLFAAWLDPFLNDWDEVFHAVVAKNMMAEPFAPMLYRETALPLDDSWSRNHIWLHKPPFFLWQIALSLKVFGLEYWAVRLPSALWMTALVPVTARMALLLTHDRGTAFLAALLTTFCFYVQELTAGAINTDHNDAVLIALVGCSWWALLEHWRSHRMGWALLAGLFAACAVLTKWQVGLSVLLPWGIVLLRERLPRSSTCAFAVAALSAMLPAAAWQLHAHQRWPALAAREAHDNWLRFTTPFEGHGGPWYAHLTTIDMLLPPYAWWLVVIALVVLVVRTADPRHRILITSLVLAVHLVFAVAATKMPGYTMVLLPLYLIALAHLVKSTVRWLVPERAATAVFFAAAVLLAGEGLDLEHTQFRHTAYRGERVEQDHWRERMRAQAFEDSLVAKLEGPGPFVLFNVPSQRGFEVMFRYGIECIDMVPSQEVVDRLRAKGYTVVVLQDTHPLDLLPQGIRPIPDSVLTYPRIPRH